MLELKPVIMCWCYSKYHRLHVYGCLPEDESAGGAAAPKPKVGAAAAAAAGAAVAGAPKMKGCAEAGAGVAFRGAADGAADWLS